MNAFQVVFIIICASQSLLTFIRFLRSKQFVTFMFLMAWSTAILFIAVPDLTTTLAEGAGIGRGVDLVTYALLVLYLYAHYQHYLRYKRVEQNVTQLVRELAIQQAWRPGMEHQVSKSAAGILNQA